MAELLIKKNLSLADIEEHLHLSDLGERALLIPHDLSEGGALGRSMQFAQFLLTWSRRGKESNVFTYLKEEDEETHKRFASRAYGLAAIYYADKVVSDRGKGADIRWSLLKSAKPRIQAMHEADLDKTAHGGTVIEFAFIEGAKRHFHGALYAKAPTAADIADAELHKRCIRKAAECNRMLHDWLSHLRIKTEVIQNLLEEYAPSDKALDSTEDGTLGRVLSEAFENTCLHAYRNVDGTKFERNFRCVKLAKHHTVGREHVRNFDLSSDQARQDSESYFNNLANSDQGYGRKNIEFLEFSILDSGPGFTASIRNAMSAIDNDVEVVARCFAPNVSSQIQDSAGKGLYRILYAIHTLGGFLRLRTDTVEAFFCSTDQFTPNMPATEFVHGDLARVEGSLITVGIPLRF